MDVSGITRRTGWTVYHRPVTASTNDDARALRDEGAPARTVVVADRQTAGRGRAGRRFASPEGGLYASLLLDADPALVPGGIVALVAVAAAEAVEGACGGPAAIKWPNDLWLGGRKVGGILLERAQAGRPVVAGLGLNLRAVPPDLPPAVRAVAAALDDVAPAPVVRDDLLAALLEAVDGWQARLPAGLSDLEGAWRARMALVGERVVMRCAGRPAEGVLEDVSLARGLLVRDGRSGAVWRPAEHVQDLGPAERRIS
jgi:BirA family biotin operon repressor/biotin-[acetyl-CoA-carboxylase] ligase